MDLLILHDVSQLIPDLLVRADVRENQNGMIFRE